MDKTVLQLILALLLLRIVFLGGTGLGKWGIPVSDGNLSFIYKECLFYVLTIKQTRTVKDGNLSFIMLGVL